MSSSMLEQAVIDAQALKEAAIKNAEQEVLDKYAGEIKEAVNSLLEQEDPMAMDPMAAPAPMATVDPLAAPTDAGATDKIVKDIPLKALDGLGINNMKDGDEIDLDLDALVKSVAFGHPEEKKQPSKTGLMFEATEADLYNLLEDKEMDAAFNQAIKSGENRLPGAGSGVLDLEEDLYYEGGVYEEDDLGEGSDIISALEGDNPDAANPVAVEPVEPVEPGPEDDSGYFGLDSETEMIVEDDEEYLYEENLDEDSIAQAIEEILKVDIKNVPRGSCGTTHPTGLEQVYAVDIAAAAAEDTELKEQDKEFDKAVKQIQNLEEHVKSLKSDKNRLVKEHNELKSIARQISDKLTELNTTNAKLVYQNRILESHSLNERQKENLVDAVSNANSTEEAKVIYETLHESLSSKGANAPQNLNEAVSKNNRLVLKSNKKDTQASNSASERMKRLAGII